MKAALVDILLFAAVGWFRLVARLLYTPLWAVTMVGRVFFPNPTLSDVLRAEPIAVRVNS